MFIDLRVALDVDSREEARELADRKGDGGLSSFIDAVETDPEPWEEMELPSE